MLRDGESKVTFQGGVVGRYLLLLEALTHRSGQSYYKLQRNYEKLELLGDAILDYLANSNLLRFTLFERYLSFTTDYKHSEDFNCADAH